MNASSTHESLTAAKTAVQQPSSRRLIVTWQHPITRAIDPIGVLLKDARGYEFSYIRNAYNVKDFQGLIGFPSFAEAYRSEALFPLFAQRAMDPRRPDFSRYVKKLGLPEDVTPWEQIATSGGRRAGDTLQLFPFPEKVREGVWACSFLVHGIRHIPNRSLRVAHKETWVSRDELDAALNNLSVGDPLRLVRNEGNPVNPEARLLVQAEGVPVGFLPNLLVEDIVRLGDENVSAFVQVINGPEAPWHMRLLARLECRASSEFQFFRGASWEPSPSED